MFMNIKKNIFINLGKFLLIMECKENWRTCRLVKCFPDIQRIVRLMWLKTEYNMHMQKFKEIH